MSVRTPQNNLQPVKPLTLAIDNFSGRLTRILNGNVNSGFAKFDKSFGYDPFTKPSNLTWMPVERDMASTAPITGLVVDAKTRFEVGTGSTVGVPYVYSLSNNSGGTNLYKIKVSDFQIQQVNSVVLTASVMASTPTFKNGGSLEFFQFDEKIYVSSDNQVNNIRFDGSGDALIATASPGSGTTGYVANQDRPLATFGAKLVLGNGPTIAAIDSTNTMTSSIFAVSSVLLNGNHASSAINPPLPQGWFVRDLDISADFNYLNILATRVVPEDMTAISSDIINTAVSQSALFQWNGSDAGITAGKAIPISQASALYTYLDDNYIFGIDAIGVALIRNTQKLFTFVNNKPPYRNAIGSNGNFIFFMTVENVPTSSTAYTRVASLYYYGSLDEQSAPGLYRILRHTTSLSGGSVYLVPACTLVENTYAGLEAGTTAVSRIGNGMHYFSVYAYNNQTSTSSSKYFRFRLGVDPSFDSQPQFGIYETQTQLFSKRIGLSQIRVYTEPTIANNGFQIDLIGSDGNVITNGTFTYTYAAGTDITKLQGSLERINFNPNMQTIYALGVRITNTGSSNMTIKKVEIDYTEEGK